MQNLWKFKAGFGLNKLKNSFRCFLEMATAGQTPSTSEENTENRKRKDEEGDDSIPPPKVRKIGGRCIDPELDPPLDDPVVFVENGLRKVKPYKFTYKAFAKRRWLGRKLVDVYNQEFITKASNVFAEAIEEGRITVNGNKITTDYLIKDLDVIRHATHRHELPIPDCKIEIIRDDDEVLVINKPAGVPVHPCGKYFYNSVSSILQLHHGYENLRGLFRLDRTTSGVLVYTKSLSLDQRLKKMISGKNVKKIYLAEVDGIFPEGEITVEKALDTLILSMGIQVITETGGKACKTVFQRISVCPKTNTSIVKCFPETGRTHQIRVHLQYLGHPIINDTVYNSTDFGPEKGKGGVYAPRDEMAKVIGEAHSYLHWVIKHLTKEEVDKTDPDYREFCEECHLLRKDPPLEQLETHLHCLRYEIDSYVFQSPPPKWAKLTPQSLDELSSVLRSQES